MATTPHDLSRWTKRARPLAVVFCAFLAAAACDSGSGSGHTDGAGRPSAPASAPPYQRAYEAGFSTGKQLFEDGGKGAAVREVNGGCLRRSLTAKPAAVVELDRGAWILGCKQGTSNSSPHPPSRPITRREPDSELLRRFQNWAAKNQAADSARRLTTVTLVHLGRADYDVELATTYTAADSGDIHRLTRDFTRWWDGDDGDATAWNILVTDSAGQRLATSNLHSQKESQ